MSYTIVIPSKTQEKADACISAIRKSGCNEWVAVVWDPAEAYIPYFTTDEKVMVFFGDQPFVFARNCNRGILVADPHDVILLNDDALIETPGGFDLLADAALSAPTVGAVSARIKGNAAAIEQKISRVGALQSGKVRIVGHHMVAFVCCYIRRRVFEHVGLLDERFVDYGFEDDDYCQRLENAGLSLGVFDGCVVEHASVASSFRGNGSAQSVKLEPNRRRFVEKWGSLPGKGVKIER